MQKKIKINMHYYKFVISYFIDGKLRFVLYRMVSLSIYKYRSQLEKYNVMKRLGRTMGLRERQQ